MKYVRDILINIETENLSHRAHGFGYTFLVRITALSSILLIFMDNVKIDLKKDILVSKIFSPQVSHMETYFFIVYPVKKHHSVCIHIILILYDTLKRCLNPSISQTLFQILVARIPVVSRSWAQRYRYDIVTTLFCDESRDLLSRLQIANLN